MLLDLIRHRDLLWLLVVREVRVRYARTLLGVAWALCLPLAAMLMFLFLNFKRLVAGDGQYASVPYPVFAYIGLIGWAHLQTSLMQGTPSLLAARSIIRKSAFPKECIPLAKVLSSLLDLMVGSLFLGYLMYRYEISPSVHLVALPVILLIQVALVAGLVLMFSALNTMFRDVNYLVQSVTPLLMFATSVVYETRSEPDAHPLIRAAFEWNPMSSILNAYREAIVTHVWPWPTLVPGAIGAVLALTIGATTFRKLSRRFAEES